jgi:hypothetical protein
LIAGLLDETLQLLRLLPPALAGLLGGELEGDGEELVLVALNVRIEEREKVFRRHARLLSSTGRDSRMPIDA